MPRVAFCTWLMDVRANSLGFPSCEKKGFPNVSLNEKKKHQKLNKQKKNKLTMESENSFFAFVFKYIAKLCIN